MSTHLKLNRSLHPFRDYPQLLDIWPEPLRSIAIEAVDEEMARIDQWGAAFSDGKIFLITDGDDINATVIGITGYFINNTLVRKPEDSKEVTQYSLYQDEITEIGLRWHGLIPSMRGKDYSRRILRQVVEQAYDLHPQVAWLTECVPLTDYGKPLERYFSNLGFNPRGAPETNDWSDHPWQDYALEIQPFLAERVVQRGKPKC